MTTSTSVRMRKRTPPITAYHASARGGVCGVGFFLMLTSRSVVWAVVAFMIEPSGRAA